MNETRVNTDTPETAEAAAKERKKRYKKSLNLPKTGFAMKANLHQNEPQSIKRWRKQGLYDRVREARSQDPRYAFHDGPPYANGEIHVGHLLNKVLKDLVVRTKTMAGHDCPYIPGWDCHGLPIEHRVLTEMVESGRIEKLNSLNEDTRRMAVRRECAAYAQKFKKLQATQMERLLTLADYDEPYMTLAPRYEQATLEVFADLIDQGIVYRDLKPVHWSIANETALAEAELEYRDREDPSIYVWFDAKKPQALADAFGVPAEDVAEQPGFMIWTTTPWTLPANKLIAVSASSEYALVRLDGRVGVVAHELLGKVSSLVDADAASVEVLARAPGEHLLGLEYQLPFAAGTGRVVAADYVSLEDGTGLVHTAPGHGADDYHTGMREGVPIYCPVRDDGSYDDSVRDDLRGLSIWDANPKIIDELRENGRLYKHHDFLHSYPHDWRSKTPVIFRATEQWFVAVDRPLDGSSSSLRDMALSASADVLYVPEWGEKRMRGMLESRPDWCLSRQRAWGLPIPAFRMPDGGVFLTAESVRAVAATFAREGSDSWFNQPTDKLLEGYDPTADDKAPDALRSGSVSVTDLRKMYDIFDVWFESGSSWNAVMRARDQGHPCDLYLEGSDQHRGWFQSSLLASLGATGEAPFRSLLTHGFIVDKDGLKMSKSLGNTLDVGELLGEFGADVCRWWVSSLAYENDIKVDHAFFELAGESYRKVRNTLRFLLSNLGDWSLDVGVPLDEISPASIDAFALQKTVELRQGVLEAYESFDFRRAHLLMFDFCNDTLSALYLDAVKDRLYCDPANSSRRRASQSVMYEIANVLTTLLAPILPHTAEEAAKALRGEDTEVHLETFAVVGDGREVWADEHWSRALEAHEAVDLALEQAKATGIENPLDAGVTVPDQDGSLSRFEADLPDLFGVSRVELSRDASEVQVEDLQAEPRCERSWKRDATVAQRSDGGWLSDRDALAVGLE